MFLIRAQISFYVSQSKAENPLVFTFLTLRSKPSNHVTIYNVEFLPLRLLRYLHQNFNFQSIMCRPIFHFSYFCKSFRISPPTLHFYRLKSLLIFLSSCPILNCVGWFRFRLLISCCWFSVSLLDGESNSWFQVFWNGCHTQSQKGPKPKTWKSEQMHLKVPTSMERFDLNHSDEFPAADLHCKVNLDHSLKPFAASKRFSSRNGLNPAQVIFPLTVTSFSPCWKKSLHQMFLLLSSFLVGTVCFQGSLVLHVS